MAAAAKLHRLEGADGLAELLAGAGVLGRLVTSGLGDATEKGRG
jgi:hypothetical protein